jgi:hypothetical protein
MSEQKRFFGLPSKAGRQPEIIECSLHEIDGIETAKNVPVIGPCVSKDEVVREFRKCYPDAEWGRTN